MSRAVVESLLGLFDAAYRDDPYHAFRQNVEAVSAEEWGVLPLNPSIGPDSEFGEQPDLSICDLALHVGGGLAMYTDRAFGPGKMEWDDIQLPAARDMPVVLAWLEERMRAFRAGLAALPDDEALGEARLVLLGGGRRLSVAQIVGMVTNHFLYHSGEINRQRALIRGTDGWAR